MRGDPPGDARHGGKAGEAKYELGSQTFSRFLVKAKLNRSPQSLMSRRDTRNHEKSKGGLKRSAAHRVFS